MVAVAVGVALGGGEVQVGEGGTPVAVPVTVLVGVLVEVGVFDAVGETEAVGLLVAVRVVVGKTMITGVNVAVAVARGVRVGMFGTQRLCPGTIKYCVDDMQLAN